MRPKVTGVEIKVDGHSGPGFLTLERLSCRNRYEDGTVSRPYRCEVVHRQGYDSVAVIPYWIETGPRRLMVVSVLAVRPAAALRASLRLEEDTPATPYIAEAVAGSLKAEDRGRKGIDRRAVEELAEETGFTARAEDLEDLGEGFLPSHGQSTEKVHLRAVRVDPGARGKATGDGSVGESDALVRTVEAAAMLASCSRGEVRDPKIEIGVRRLCERVGFLPELGIWADELPEEFRARWKRLAG